MYAIGLNILGSQLSPSSINLVPAQAGKVIEGHVCQTGYMSLVGYHSGPFWDPCCSSFLLMTGVVNKLVKFANDTKLM